MTSLPELTLQQLLNQMDSSVIDLEVLKMFKKGRFDSTEWIMKVVNEYICSGNEENRREDISRLIYLGMKRGNRVSKIIETSKEEKAEWLKKIVEELDIKDNIKDDTGEPSNKTLTLSKLKKAYPGVAFDILRQPNFKSRVTLKMIKNKIQEFKFLPLIARDMCIMSLLPKWKTEEFDKELFSIMVHHIFIYCLCESALFVSNENSKESFKMKAEEVIKYMKISWDGKHIKHKEREMKAKEMKDYFGSLKEDEMKALKTQCDLIQRYASKFGINILEDFKFVN